MPTFALGLIRLMEHLSGCLRVRVPPSEKKAVWFQPHLQLCPPGASDTRNTSKYKHCPETLSKVGSPENRTARIISYDGHKSANWQHLDLVTEYIFASCAASEF